MDGPNINGEVLSLLNAKQDGANIDSNDRANRAIIVLIEPNFLILKVVVFMHYITHFNAEFYQLIRV